MNRLNPFRATLFDPARSGDLGAVLCPPYDVVSQQDQYRLYLRSPCNVIRLELGQDLPGDDQATNRYTRANEQLAAWLAEGVLREDESPAFYLYVQEWEGGGSRTSFYAAVRLAEWDKGEVIPHEQTLSGPKADRLLLMRHTAANMSPVFGLYADPSGVVRQILAEAQASEPDLAAEQGAERHRLWRIARWDDVAAIQEALSNQPIYIADGHHRYETALAYRDECRERQGAFTGEEPWNSVLMCLADVAEPGLEVLPTHRLVKAKDLDAAALVARLGEVFAVEERPAPDTAARIAATDRLLGEMKELNEAGRHALGLALPGEARVLLLTLREDPRELLSGFGRSPAWRELDVAILHYLVILEMLGIPEGEWKGGKHLVYTRDHKEVLAGLESGEFQAGFFLNPTPVAQVVDVARAGDVMPQKSTFFYPKLPTGLVLHRLGEVPALGERPVPAPTGNGG
ncbi:MAG: DUF1015 domain-containing protein [Candidatus Sericytochromatia bacterium]|nr:DUF1015 domain-containing protein [Candidatus Tanganyikabacteria bacterium]